ncbi:CUB domain-containing protein 1 [Brachyhypopomus gauderio]|uniref:CUB domain-containing protein 1 n=1 Tax=Brachyhypopomus gauderio TaxID=698409 RepID=UPI004040F5B4
MGSLLLGLFLLFILQTSEGQVEFVIPEPGTRVIIEKISTVVSNCTVCVGDSPTCGPKATLTDPQNTKLTFTCPKPQDIFSVEVNRDIDCSKSCAQDTIHPASSILPNFDRFFTWDLKVSPTKAFQLDFPAPGMKQIQSSEQCLDKHTYTIVTYSRAGTVNIGTFCQTGTVSRMQFLWKGRVSLAVPRGTVLNSPDFNYSETIVSSAGSVIADAVLARGMSDSDFFSPTNIPNDYIMKWNFVVPPMHNFTVNFVTYTEPKCQSKVVKVLYQQDNKSPIDKTLADNQLTNYQGNFSLSLTNCEVKKGETPSLFLHFRVSVFRSGTPYLCTVDLQNDKSLRVELEHKTLDSFCELSVDSVVQQAVTVLPGSKALLSFLDCRSDELRLTATKTIECQTLSSCSLAGIPLTVPALDACLPTPLQEVVWVLQMPQGVAIELKAPQGSLKQAGPGQDCFTSMSVLVSEADGSSVGCFSYLGSKGYMDKVQIASNVTVTAVAGATGLSQNGGPFLSVSFSPRISENYIYTMSLSPLAIPSVSLMTPNWPETMKSESTASWIINIPEEYSAELSFLNVSLPSCQERHMEVIVKEMGSEDEISFREDASVPQTFSLSGSFYLNMSNCESAGRFAILSQISLQKKSKKVLSIILGVIGVLLALLLIVLIVVCVIVRKKKRQLTNRSSINMPKGAAFLPGDASFPTARTNNESHVYDYIDDTMVYGHLLNEDGPGHFNGHQVDTYRMFPGSTEPTGVQSEPDRSQADEGDSYRAFLAPSETFLPPRPRSPLGPLNSVGFEDRRMVDNELYTFKNISDQKAINLFDDDRLPPPDVEYDDVF